MECQRNNVKEEISKIGVKILKGKTKCITNIDTTYNTQIDGTEIEKVTGTFPWVKKERLSTSVLPAMAYGCQTWSLTKS